MLRGVIAALLPLFLLAPPAGAFRHDGGLGLDLGPDGRCTLTQPGAAPFESPCTVTPVADGAFTLALPALPPYRLRRLDAGGLGLSGGALAFEIPLHPAF